VAAAEASLRQARAHELLTMSPRAPWTQTRDEVANARALAEQAKVELGYSQVFAPVSGKVNVRAARQGEVVAAGRAHRDHHGPDADLGLRAAAGDAGRRVQLGDSLRVVMPSGATVRAR
jgi:HlyD family secretion protein